MGLTLTFGHALDRYDPRDYGAVMDLKRIVAGINSGSFTLTKTAGGSFSFAAGDAGKLVTVPGAGTILATASDGAMDVTVNSGFDANILTSASGAFTNALLGRTIQITGVGAGGATLVTKVWGVISPTQLRVITDGSTTATGVTYTIAEDLYATINSVAAPNTATLDTAAGNTVTTQVVHYGTDDAAAIQACITAALADVPRSESGIAPTIYFARPFGIGATIDVTGTNCRMRFEGAGLRGYSSLLAIGSVFVRALRPGLTAYIRVAANGTVGGQGMGMRGAMTAASAVLTDPEGTFTAGDVGKDICVLGAGVQTGSSEQVALITTIAGFTSATQVTLSATASTTVTEAIYSWAPTTVIGANAVFEMERMHLIGGPGQKCGLHIMAGNNYVLDKAVISDFRSGISWFADGFEANTQCCTAKDCILSDSRIHAKITYSNLMTFTGYTLIDGNSNSVGVTPGPGTVGIECNSVIFGQGTIQACEKLLVADGSTGSPSVFVQEMNCECFATGIELRSNGVNGGNGSIINIQSWSSSGSGGATSHGLVLKAGVVNVTFTPGYYLPTNIDMYGACDATALRGAIVHDPHLRGAQAPAFVASYTPDLALGQTIAMAALTGNVTAIGAPLRATAGTVIRFIFLQDGVGGRTVGGWNAVYKLLNWVPNTGAGKRNTIDFIWDGTNWVQSGAVVQT